MDRSKRVRSAKRSGFFAAASLLASGAIAAERIVHVVLPRETLSGIAHRSIPGPVYGKRGSLARIRSLNPQLEDADRIHAGQRIFLPGIATRLPSEAAPSPAPPAAPSPAPPAAARGVGPLSDLSVQLVTGYSRIDASTSTGQATLLSQPSLGAGIEWRQHWSDVWTTRVRYGAGRLSFKNSDRGALGDPAQLVTETAFGVGRAFSPSTIVNIELGAKDQLFAPSYVAGTATLETRPMTFARVSLEGNILRRSALSLDGEAAAGILFGASGSAYDVKNGSDASVELRLVQRMEAFSFFAGLRYARTAQDTSLATQSQTDLQTRFGFTLPLGKDDRP